MVIVSCTQYCVMSVHGWTDEHMTSIACASSRAGFPTHALAKLAICYCIIHSGYILSSEVSQPCILTTVQLINDHDKFEVLISDIAGYCMATKFWKVEGPLFQLYSSCMKNHSKQLRIHTYIHRLDLQPTACLQATPSFSLLHAESGGSVQH